MKLTSGQSESLELLYASICNANLYAEDLFNDKTLHQGIRYECIQPMLVKLKWLKQAIELKLPFEKRVQAKTSDTLVYDEILRLLTHLPNEKLSEVEQFLNNI